MRGRRGGSGDNWPCRSPVLVRGSWRCRLLGVGAMNAVTAKIGSAGRHGTAIGQREATATDVV